MFFAINLKSLEIDVSEELFVSFLKEMKENTHVCAFPDFDGVYYYYHWSCNHGQEPTLFANSSELFSDYVDVYM